MKRGTTNVKIAKWFVGTSVAVLVFCLLVRMHAAPEVLLVWASGAVCLAWLVALVTVPWNLHFHARSVRADLDRVAARGVTVERERFVETERIARRTLFASVASHVVSAAIIGTVAWRAHQTVWFYFAGFFLVSVAFRPGFEYFRYLRRRLVHIHDDARYPFEDVAALVTRVDAAAAGVRIANDAVENLRASLEQQRTTSERRDDELDRKLAQIVRRFDETLDRLTDNREIVAGLKAFLRMVKTEA